MTSTFLFVRGDIMLDTTNRVRLAIVAATMVCAGCGAIPTVQYKPITKSEDMKGMADAFYLQKSVIVVELGATSEAKDKDGNAVKVTELSIKSEPAEAKDAKYGIRPVTNFLSSTTVTLSKIANTDLVSSADVEVTDKLAKSINDFGGAVVKLIGLAAVAAAAPGTECLPARSQPVRLQLAYDKDDYTFDGPGLKGCIKVMLQALPPDAAPRSSLPTGNSNNFYYSACRDAAIEVTQGKDLIKRTVRVADPRYVQSVEFPAKGTVTMHSACGVSVKTEKTASDNTASVVDALSAQGKAIKDAIEAAKK
jgi:hypothetical protein